MIEVLTEMLVKKNLKGKQRKLKNSTTRQQRFAKDPWIMEF